MEDESVGRSVHMDRLDEQIARCIQLSPRAPHSVVAEVLGVAEQTVARRYRRLRREGLVRVTLSVDPRAFGVTVWSIRIRCRPEAADRIATALAQRNDVSWVAVYSAGWEVGFNLRAVRAADTEELLTKLLPKAPVLGVSSAAILHTFVGGAPTDWEGWRNALTREQVSALRRRTHTDDVVECTERVELTAADRVLLDALSRDGRTPYATLARATGSTPGRVTRRVEALVGAGVAVFDVDIAPAASGLHTTTTLWATVTPGNLETVGRLLADHPDVPFAAAVTGTANLTASILTGTLQEVYPFVTTVLAAAPGITGYELVPLTRRVKHAGARLTGDRLAPPTPMGRG